MRQSFLCLHIFLGDEVNHSFHYLKDLLIIPDASAGAGAGALCGARQQ
jgi:hypothetical protein